jgi:hypothetical protein
MCNEVTGYVCRRNLCRAQTQSKQISERRGNRLLSQDLSFGWRLLLLEVTVGRQCLCQVTLAAICIRHGRLQDRQRQLVRRFLTLFPF